MLDLVKLAAGAEPSNVQVVLMGILTVFVVLVMLIIIIKVLGAVVTAFTGKKSSSPVVQAPVAAAPVAAAQPVAQAMATSQAMTTSPVNKQQVVAAISAAIAEDMGADISAIRIHSIRQLFSGAPCIGSSCAPCIGNNQQMVAAVSAAIAQDMGTDVSGMRIHSIKKL